MIKFYSRLQLLSLYYVFNATAVFGNNEGLLDDVHLGGNLEDDDCDGGTDGIVKCKSDEFECTDNHENCARWSSSGECDSNPSFMPNICKNPVIIAHPIASTSMNRAPIGHP